MKKLLLPLLLCTLLALLLCACTTTPPSDETLPHTPPVTEAPTDPATEPPTEEATETPTEEETTEAPTEEVTTDYFEANRIEIVEPDPTKFADLTLTDEGVDIYQLPSNGNGGWRYGPSYIYYGDGRVDAYFASGGDSGEWDRITHRSSADDGATWGPEKIVVYPTPGSMDGNSCCDPDVVYFDGYYYLGYTSTLNDGGYCNNVFVARSENPDGPFEKWNGSGWGGAPMPIFYFEQSYGYWGIGEPSMIELNGTLYIYYSYATPMKSFIMLATADATNENWPSTLTHHGAIMEKKSDSVCVKFVEDWGKFILVTREDVLGNGNCVVVYESADGKSFTLVDAVRENTCPGMFSMGLSSRKNGHIRLSEDADRLRLAYAYGDSGWAAWNTRMHKVTLTQSEGNDLAAESAKSPLNVGITREEEPFGWEEWTMIRTQKDLFILSKGEKQNVNLYFRDRYVNGKDVSMRDKEITVTDYDESVVSFKNGRMIAEGVGETAVTVRYKDLAHVFRVVVVATDEEKEAILAETTVEPAVSDFTIYLGERVVYRPQIRVRITKGDGTVTEIHVNDGPDVVTYSGYDENVITVNEKGVITARAAGSTTVTVKYGTHTMKVNVKVSADPADTFFGMGDMEEMNYVSLDFTKEIDRTVPSYFNSCEMTATEEGMRVTVKSAKTQPGATDPSFKVVYQGALDPIMTEDYTAVEIVYRVPLENTAHTTRMEIFIGAGSIMDAQGGYSTQAELICDGEFHTLTIPVSHLDYWKGQLNVIRFDFFTAALTGDAMDISSISLVS
ncbi:MAG: exo-alpha-sialidase [Clostridia bacterium]|nr:exo-alpha-sialidase [Clostridia bacterium]